MIISVRANLNEIFEQGRKFKWGKPCNCPRCGSVRLWGHGFVFAYFDGFSQGLILRRFRCPDCRCLIRMKPKGYFPRFRAGIAKIRTCLSSRLFSGKWLKDLSGSRQRHWLAALKRKSAAFFSVNEQLMNAFDRLIAMGQIPVSRAI
ncbi:MAG: hypothetical protein PVI90_16250 [Desulfobacteraceae bacterium]|jgi:hypothetical protein